jgi:hypothetical protein
MTVEWPSVKDEPVIGVARPVDKNRPGLQDESRVEVMVRVDLGLKMARRPACVWLGAAPVE